LRHPPPGDATLGGRSKVKRVGVREVDGQRIRGVRLPYRPGLDGLRALAVIAVLLYHAGLTWIPGGFLGVEVFFVISGYLITALLLAEWRVRGRVDLKAFWLRRARRLLPALYLLLVVTLAYAVVFLPHEVAGLRGDALAAFGYVTNWYLVFGQESYFEAVGRPSLLKHLWSLAVEEQFYIFWPLVFAVGIGVGATRFRRRRVVNLALAGAGASAMAMAVLYVPGVDPSRIYYGTDTRATGLLFGAALAFLWSQAGKYRPADTRHQRLELPSRSRFRRRWGWVFPTLLDLLGLAALGGLVWFCLRLGEFQPFLYRGGFALVALTTVVAIMAVVHPSTRLGAGLLLGWGPLRWIGERSYGIYLWHWPVFTITRPGLDVPLDGPPLLALRLAATIVLAHLSYWYVEEPIRRGALGRAWKALREARGRRRQHLRRQWAGAIASGLALCTVLGIAVAHAEPPDQPSYLSSMKAVHTAEAPPRAPTAEVDSPPTDESPPPQGPQEDRATPTGSAKDPQNRRSETGGEAGAAGSGAGKDASSAKPGTEARDVTSSSEGSRQEGRTLGAERTGEPEFTGSVSAIGDSVMLGAVGGLQKDIQGLAVVDAEVGMQVYTAIDILRARSASGQLGEVVVVHLGNNGTFTEKQFDEIMGLLAGVDRVVFVNVKVPRAWERPNNQVIYEGVQRYPNAVLLDWYSASVNRPEFFYNDGFHLRPIGQRAYADLISSNLAAP
jgi:peptidoglycan/LPS O-acetylase OafA/YrhL